MSTTLVTPLKMLSQQDQHKKLKLLLERCSRLGIRLNKAKSVLCRTEVQFLGNLISSEGLTPDPGKVDAILKLQRSTSVQKNPTTERNGELPSRLPHKAVTSHAATDVTH